MAATIDATRLIRNIMIRISEDPRSEVTHEDLFNSLVSMIKWTRQFKNKEEVVELSRGIISSLMWAKELCTVKFCLPRQSGHTTFLKRLLGEYGPEGANGELFKSPVVIFPNYSVAQTHGFPTWSWVGSPGDMRMNKFRGKECDGVIVDCSSVLSNKEIEQIYDGFKANALSNPNLIFVFLE